MIIYNVTVSIDEAIHPEWLLWMRQTHIPDVMQTGLFHECRISKIHAEEEGGVTYAIAYLSESMDHLQRYKAEHAPRLQKEHSERFAGRFAAFRTIMEVVEEFRK